MRSGSAATAAALLAAVSLSLLPAAASAQFRPGEEAIGQYYRLEFPLSAERVVQSLQLERVAPSAFALAAPIAPIPLPVPLRALTGQISERPERQRLYFTALDSRGVARLLEIDLLSRQSRMLLPPQGATPPYAAQLLAAPDASKLYVRWFRPADPHETDIYDGETLRWLGNTLEFQPDERASGFEHRPPFLWTLDLADRPVLVDTNADIVLGVFDPQRWFSPLRAVAADAWRDLILFRVDAGHDRFHVVDIISGEVGPAFDLAGYEQASARLVLSGRYLALIGLERRPSRFDRWRETAVATGPVQIYDLREGGQVAEFRLAPALELPVAAVGSHEDPSLPGRLWVHVPGDQQRIDLRLPGCDGKSPRADRIEGTVEAAWDSSSNRSLFRYRLRVDASSPEAAGSFAIQAGRETERSGAPDGWGVDLIKGERWLRWSNGLGPAREDVAPGSSVSGFALAARAKTRPGIVEYRIQAAMGLPRGCEPEDRFLDNSLRGYTIGPDRVSTGDPPELATRLRRLVGRACEIGWISAQDCPGMRAAADAVQSNPQQESVARFLALLDGAGLEASAAKMFVDAASAVLAVAEPQP